MDAPRMPATPAASTAPLRAANDRERGQVIVLFAIFLVVILASAALVVDLGLLRNDRQTLVNTVDSAALAGGTLMPVNGATEGAAATALIKTTIAANYPGLSTSNYSIAYQCLIGVDTSTPAKPFISRDVPIVCDPSKSLGRPPLVTDFQGAGPTRYASCFPSLGDKCNTVVVSGNVTTPYSFARVVGINSGSTGVVMSAACNGPCGETPAIPVDVVLIMDRTASMTSTDIADIQTGAKTLLGVFDPALQRVALGTIGPSAPGKSSCPSGSTSPVKGLPSPANQVFGVGMSPQSNVDFFAPSDLPKWVPVGFTGTDTATPAVTFNEAYSTGGVTNTSSTIWKAVSCLYSYTYGTNLDTPVAMAEQYLATYGRPGVKKAIILETDGTPQAGDGSAHYTCNAANNTATAAKNGASKVDIFTIGFGIGGAFCPTRSGGSNTNPNESTGWSGKSVATLLTSMATSPTQFYDAPDSATLVNAFRSVAQTLAKGGSHLIQLYPIPIVTAVSPSSGTFVGGVAITVTGKYFTGATSVKVGGAAATFVVSSDTSISVITPGGSKGSTVDIVVTTPGGSSPIVSGDRYTYN